MELLTAELQAQLPLLYAQEELNDKMVFAKFFTPDSNWTWFPRWSSQNRQWWSGQNRPTDPSPGLGCFTLLPLSCPS